MRRIVAFCKPGSAVRVSDLSPEVQGPNRMASGSAPHAEQRDGFHVDLDQPLDAAVEELERAMIRRALEHEGGHMEHAAERLGISRKGLFLKRRRLGLDR